MPCCYSSTGCKRETILHKSTCLFSVKWQCVHVYLYSMLPGYFKATLPERTYSVHCTYTYQFMICTQWAVQLCQICSNALLMHIVRIQSIIFHENVKKFTFKQYFDDTGKQSSIQGIFFMKMKICISLLYLSEF